MRFRFHIWQLPVLVIVVCAGAVALAHWHQASRRFDASALIQCLPQDRATHVYIDAAALRASGILDLVAGAKAAEEADYRNFVDQTGFDYRTDLDAVAAAFMRGDVYMALRGRFDWKKLSEYARSNHGECRNTVCQMPASEPGRYISFYPLKSGVLALAVSTQQSAVTMIGPNQWKNPPRLPPEPVWISAPAFDFTDVANLPAGTHAFLSPLADAQRVTFAVGLASTGQLEIRLDVTCADAASAATLTNRLTAATDLLKKMLARDHMTPNPRDLSGVLVAGNFKQQDRRVTGIWPIDRAFVQSLAGGTVQ
ncbi:MAG: hypothetical protein ACRD30_03665 [Bryobacteraceae bacterium]